MEYPTMRRRSGLPILAFFVALISFQCCCAGAQRAIPDDNLAYPVLIAVGDGSLGSGFFLNTRDSVYLVTAKHVLFNPSNQTLVSPHLELLSYSKDPADPTQIRITVNLSILQSNGDLRPHATQDVAVVRLFRADAQPTTPSAIQPSSPTTQQAVPPTTQPGESSSSRAISSLPGVTIQSMAQSGILGVGMESIKTFDQVLTGNDVMLFGYPSSLALRQLRQLDPSRPLLRKGIVAGTNPAKKSIILDCPVYFGNSGGPALEMDKDGFQTRLKIIGVVDQYVPFVQTGGSQTFEMQFVSNSGYSIITPMDFVLELTR
jgi:hypothetical protein